MPEPQVEDLFGEEAPQQEDEATDTIEQEVEEPTEDNIEVDSPGEETVTEESQEVEPEESQEEVIPSQPQEASPDQDLKYLRDIVFSDDKLFEQVMAKARQLQTGDEPIQEQETLEMPEYPEDDTDSEAMKDYLKQMSEYNQRQTQIAIQQALAEERRKSQEEQARIKAETERNIAINAIKEEYKLDDNGLVRFLEWAKNPSNGDMVKYMKTLYSVYQNMNTPQNQSKQSRLNEAASKSKGASANVNAANIGGGNEVPLNDNDSFNDAFMEAYKRNRKIF